MLAIVLTKSKGKNTSCFKRRFDAYKRVKEETNRNWDKWINDDLVHWAKCQNQMM